MAFCTREFMGAVPWCKMQQTAHVRTRLGQGSAYAYSMRDDFAAKHMLYFLPEHVQNFNGKHPSDGQQRGAEAHRESFIYREMTDFAVYSHERPYKIVRVVT